MKTDFYGTVKAVEKEEPPIPSGDKKFSSS
jgi:hypothetical protein